MFNKINIIYNHLLLIKDILQIYYYKIDINDKSNIQYIDNLYKHINNSGCMMIKCVQWIIPRYSLLYPNSEITHTFNSFYENCKTHSIKFTEKLYYKYFNKNIHDYYEIKDIIGSGSIGQVYLAKCKITNKDVCIKVIHPDINFQYNLFCIFFKIILYCINVDKIIPVNNINLFIDSLGDQLNLVNEYNYNKKFQNTWKNIKNYNIPEIYTYNKDILIMEYLSGDIYESIKLNSEKYKIVIMLLIFLEYSLTNNILHGDLHIGNWRINKINNKYSLSIFDFGFCVSINKEEIDYVHTLSTCDDRIGNLHGFLNYYLYKDYNKTVDKNYILSIYKNEFIKHADRKTTLVEFYPDLIKFLIKYNIKVSWMCINAFVLFLQISGLFIYEDCTAEPDFIQYNTNIISMCKHLNILPELIVKKEKEIYNNNIYNNYLDGLNKFNNLKKYM